MTYHIYFTMLSFTGDWIDVGEDWVVIPQRADSLLREVCGSYPSDWDGKKCSDISIALAKGVALLSLNPTKYKTLEGDCVWCNVNSIRDLLTKIVRMCEKFPTATIRVAI